MKISKMEHWENTYLIDKSEKTISEKNVVSLRGFDDNSPAADVFISEEGRSALREKIHELGLASEHMNPYDLDVGPDNAVSLEHYFAIREMVFSTGGIHDTVSFAEHIMEAYAAVYNQVIQEHESGDRQVGHLTATLEEDLDGLDKAFQWNVLNLENYIAIEQLNKSVLHHGRAGSFLQHRPKRDEHYYEDYYSADKEYQKTSTSMMMQAHDFFLALFKNSGYAKGVAGGIISNIMNNNEDFMLKTKLIFSEIL